MRVERIELTNWKQHRNLSIEISASTAGLIGRNGQGKSNLLTAIGDIITGEFSPSKERIITWGEAKAKGRLHIGLPDGRKMTITREISRDSKTTKAVLEITGEEKVTGSDKVTSRILEVLKVDKSILQNIVFVKQDEIQELLFSGVAKERLAARFFGLEKAQGLEKFLGSKINEIKYDSAGDDAAGLRQRLDGLQESYRQLWGQWNAERPLAEMEAELQRLGKERIANSTLKTKIEGHKSLAVATQALSKQLADMLPVFQSKREAFAANTGALNSIDIEQSRTLRQKHTEQLAINQKIDHTIAALEGARKNKEAAGTIPYDEAEVSLGKIEIESLRSQFTISSRELETVRETITATIDVPTEIESLKPQLLSAEQVVTIKKLIEDLTGWIAVEANAIKQKSDILSVVGSQAICPTCTQPIDPAHRERFVQEEGQHRQRHNEYSTQKTQAEQRLAQAAQAAVLIERWESWQKLKAREAALEAQSSEIKRELDSRVAEIEPKAQANEQWQNRFANLVAVASAYETALASFGEKQPAEPDRFLQIETAYNELAAQLRVDRQELDEQEREHKRLSEALAEQAKQQQAFVGITDETGAYLPTKEDAEFEAQILELEGKRVLQSNLESQLRTLNAQVEEVKVQTLKAEAAERNNRLNRKFAEQLEALRRAFHPDGAPKTLVTRATKQLESRINAYLTMLEVEFQVVVKEGLNFDCVFPGGTAQQDELSGGQKIDLSWAFRLAACETFSSSVGLMCMDEPTVWLDEETKGRFNDIVEHLKDLADQYGMQFIISTHDKNLISHFGCVFQF